MLVRQYEVLHGLCRPPFPVVINSQPGARLAAQNIGQNLLPAWQVDPMMRDRSAGLKFFAARLQLYRNAHAVLTRSGLGGTAQAISLTVRHAERAGSHLALIGRVPPAGATARSRDEVHHQSPGTKYPPQFPSPDLPYAVSRCNSQRPV